MTDQMIDRTDFFKQLAIFVAEDMQERQRDSHDMTDLMLALARFEDGRALAPRKKLNADGIIKDLDVLLSRYVRALLFLSIATFVAYSIAFSLMGVPYAMLLAGLAAVLELKENSFLQFLLYLY